MPYQRYEKRIAYFYTFLIMILFSIPSYFALNFAFDKELLNKELILERYTNELIKNIHSNNIDSSNSVTVKSALFTNNYEKKRFNLTKDLSNYDFNKLVLYPYLYYKKEINKNSYDISYVVTQIELNYSKIIFIGVILFLLILVNIYILNKTIIQNTAKPYELIQKYMNSFFNDTMHELKTPLGIISLNLDLLIQKTETSKYTKRMKTALKQMQITYEDLEYYIKNKRVKYLKNKISLSIYLNSRIAFFKDLANAKSIKIETTIDKRVYIYMNTLELQRIIDNTLSNAIKYSNFEGLIEINLTKDEDFCYLIFKDYGLGISNTKDVFDRFKREDKIQGGFGLGLNIVKNICNKNAIKILISSELDKGSIFTYKIKLYKNKFLDKVENEN